MSKFLTIRDKANSTEILMYGDILMDESCKYSKDDTCPSDIIEALEKADGKPVTIRINSGGGSVFGGMAIYNVLKAYKGHKTVYVDGVAASIASILMLCGDELHIPKNAYVMVHKPWSIAVGNTMEMKQVIETLEVCEAGMRTIYENALKEGGHFAPIADALDNGTEKWFTGEEIAEVFNVISDEPVKAAALVSDVADRFCHIPAEIVRMTSDKVQEAEDAEAEEEKTDAEESGGSDTDGLIASTKAYLYIEEQMREMKV